MTDNDNTEEHEAGIMFGKAFGLAINSDLEARNMFFAVAQILHASKEEVPDLGIKFASTNNKTNEETYWSIDFEASIKKITKEEYDDFEVGNEVQSE